jgi:2-aminoadipate transaminase
MSHERFLSRAAAAMQPSPIRQMGAVAAQRADVISFAPGYPGPDAFAWEAYRTIADRVLARRDRDLLQYGPTRGYPPLIDALQTLHAARDITAERDEILVTTGSQQGLDLVSRTLIDPGDVVLVELPSYTGAILAFRNAQAALVGIRQEADGIDLTDLDRTLHDLRSKGRRVKFLYVVPNFQNPTGLLMSLAKRRALLAWAMREQVLIVEDDPYGALYFDDAAKASETRSIKADDPDGWVIYLSSLSKTLAPAFRTAWVVASPTLAMRMELAKQATDLCTGNFDQRLVLEAIRDGVLESRLPTLREYYRTKRVVMEEALRAEIGDAVRWPAPRGGFFLWASLAPPLDAPTLLPFALNQGVTFVVGHAFFIDHGGGPFMRLAFSLPTHDQIREGVRRLGAAVREAQASAAVSPARET